VNGGGPYREGPRLVMHVCLLCYGSYGVGPGNCVRCRVMRSPVDDPAVYSAMLEEAHKRTEVSRFKLDPLIETRQRKDAPSGRKLEDLSTDELIAWLGMEAS
jgi:hypothetical protein